MMVLVLVVVCLCVFGLVTSTAVFVGTAFGVRYGFFIRGGDILEKVNNLDIVIFDKIGMLIIGKLVLMEMCISGGFSDVEIIVFVGVVE